MAANKIDMSDEDSEEYARFKEHVEKAGYEVYPMSAPINYGVQEVIQAAARLLAQTEAEPDQFIETFDFERDDTDPDFRKVYASRDGNAYRLEGKQLMKIFRSTNFNDIGSLRYLYKYIEKSGALDELRKLGLDEGDTIKIDDFEFEYIDEF